MLWVGYGWVGGWMDGVQGRTEEIESIKGVFRPRTHEDLEVGGWVGG